MKDTDEIQNELQGSGFLKEVKEKRLPNSAILSDAALEKYEKNYASLNPDTINRQADRILARLLEFEREIYKEREQRVYREALVVFLQEKYDTGQSSLDSFSSSNPNENQFAEYPHLQEMFAEIEEIYNTAENFGDASTKILPLLYPAMDAISVSAQQSRRKRAGNSLRTHIENMMEKAGFIIEDSQGAGSGLVFQIRREEEGHIEPVEIYVSFLTTLRDRFRQSLSNSINRDDVPQFILTGAGNNIFTASSNSGVTDQKVNEITNEGFTLVVFDEVKQKEHHDKEDVITYSDFFSDRLPEVLQQ